MRNIKQNAESLFTDYDKQDIVGFFMQRNHYLLIVYDNAEVLTID